VLGRAREAELFAGVDAAELARMSATLDTLIRAVERVSDGTTPEPGRPDDQTV
jgi:hypothetical protein